MVNITVVMPLYNAQRFLPETLDSVLKQTYKDFELICVDDGSTDDTVKILKEYQQKDNRIKIIVKPERSGAAESRNIGMREAVGEYITFLDGDDIFDEEMLEAAYQTMENHNADVCVYELKIAPSEKVYEKAYKERSEKFLEEFCKKTFSMREKSPRDFWRFGFNPCNKLYRRSFVQAHKLEFQSLSCCNDVYFVCMALLLSKRTIMLEERRVMLYARNHSEPSRISNDRDLMCIYRAMEKIQMELIQRGQFDELFQHYYYRLFFHIRMSILGNKNQQRRVDFCEFLKKEGMKHLTSISDAHYQKVDWKIKSLLDTCMTETLTEHWLGTHGFFSFMLQENIEQLRQLLDIYEKSGKKVISWGAGKNGVEFLRILAQNGLKLEAVVDKDEKKWGTTIEEYIVRKPNDVLSDTDVIFVVSDVIYNSVKAEVGSTGIEIINIAKYLDLE